ncbi:Flp family type IVb pilin [Chelativorans xinjiangense]|uniref:Flp family type IVb pilin n=1 Tax=Chelativorans xinjiangense TaxID=2681485 RepID=UPI001356AB1E|nr:Flp family type IVb pilin [Chelativorans xinjiangense]
MLKKFLASEDGTTAVEYALIAGILVLAIVTGVAELGRYVGATYDNVADEVTAANN